VGYLPQVTQVSPGTTKSFNFNASQKKPRLIAGSSGFNYVRP